MNNALSLIVRYNLFTRCTPNEAYSEDEVFHTTKSVKCCESAGKNEVNEVPGNIGVVFRPQLSNIYIAPQSPMRDLNALSLFCSLHTFSHGQFEITYFEAGFEAKFGRLSAIVKSRSSRMKEKSTASQST